MLEVDLLIYGHCPALAEGVPPLSAWQLRQPGPRILWVEPARPNCYGLLVQRRQAFTAQGPSHPCPPPSLSTHSPSERPRSNDTSPSSSPCQKQSGCYPSVSCVGEAEKERARPMINISLEPRRPVISHLALALFSSSPDLRTQLPLAACGGLDDLACFACMTPDSLSAGR